MIFISADNNDFIPYLPPTPFTISYEGCMCTCSTCEGGADVGARREAAHAVFTNNNDFTPMSPFIISCERCMCIVTVKVVLMLEPSVHAVEQHDPAVH